MYPTLRVLGRCNQRPEIRGRVNQGHGREVLRHQNIGNPLANPRFGVQTNGPTTGDASGDAQSQLAVRAALLDGLVDALEPIGKDPPAALHIVRVKEGTTAVVIEVEFKAIHRIVLQGFLNQGKTQLADFRSRKIGQEGIADPQALA